MQEARAVVEERRGEALHGLPLNKSIDGVFTWAKAPEAGTTCKIFYNKAAGGLKSVDSVVLHIGYDNWWMRDKRVIPLSAADAAAVKKLKLPEGDWWSADVSLLLLLCFFFFFIVSIINY